MKSSRLLSMLLMLQGVERKSARELAEALEVSERTVYRDVDALSASGVPIYAERGAQGGICIAEGYRKALTQFGEDEIRALFISGSNPLIDLGLGIERERALQKLSGALSDVQRKAVQKTRGRIHLDQRRWNQAEQPQELLSVLRRAVWEDARVLLRYRDRESKITERTVDPFGLVAKAGIWYLVARSGDELRTFRAERIIDVTPLAQTFERPADFDLDSYWKEWISAVEESGKRFPVVLSVPAAFLDESGRYWETQLLAPRPENGEGTVEVRIVFPASDAAVHQLLFWGSRVKLIEPLELGAELAARAKELLAHYSAKKEDPA
ncbi:MAG: YafY family transcriptional regulator [Candidatus Eremiobacteraeota bacterium]|nr:YafY family transcriptional regulator [Candidatus Eremiobacteraeota bacterium]